MRAGRLLRLGRSPIASRRKIDPQNRLMQVSARTKQYHARCEALRQRLGNRCANCGCGGPFQFDCIVPVGRDHHLYGSLNRIRFYELHEARGKLQLLCIRCHTAKNIAEARERRRLRLTQSAIVIQSPS